MANSDRPNGFRPRKTVSGAPVARMLRKYTVAARVDATNNHGDIYIGDPVTLSTAGVLTVANSGAAVLGVVVGVGTDSTEFGPGGMWDADNLEKRYLAHDEAGYVWVAPAEDTIFEVQTASALGLSPGEQADFTVAAGAAHGSRTTGWSTAELTTALNNDVVVVEDVESPDNDTALANARHLVMFKTTVNAQ